MKKYPVTITEMFDLELYVNNMQKALVELQGHILKIKREPPIQKRKRESSPVACALKEEVKK